MIIGFKNKSPRVGMGVFIAPTATIIGDVEIGDYASIWYGAIVRGDLAPIHIGKRSNIQDNCILHTDEGYPIYIGDTVTVGHNAVIHGCHIENNCLIGISAVVLNGAQIKTGSVIAAGSVVKENQIVGPYHLVAGVPSTLKKEFSKSIVTMLEEPATIYLNLAKDHMKLCEPPLEMGGP